MPSPSAFTPAPVLRARPTHRKACSRCRKRKIRCDAALPSCSSCLRANVRCMGYDTEMNEIPRSLVTHLEEEVAALEMQLRAHEEAGNTHTGSQPSVPIPSQHELAYGRALANAIADAAIPLGNSDALMQSTVRCSFQLRTSRLPLPVMDQKSHTTPPKKAASVRDIPSAASDLMLKNYTEVHLPQYPCVSEVYLLAAFQRCMDDDASLFDVFVVSIAMAISANTLLWKHEDNALSASAGFWAAAKVQLEQPEMLQDEVQHLQYCLLMAHYGFTNPAAVDVWYCIGDAVRLCVQLGYHRDISPGPHMSPAEVDSRRRLFWTTCGMEWTVSSHLRIPPALASNLITTKFPSSLSDLSIQMGIIEGDGPRKKAAALHMLTFRRLEMECLRVLYLNDPIDSFDDWSTNIMTQLEEWYQKSFEFAAEKKLEFRNIQYNYLRGRMHKPTPRVRQPSQASRLICIESAKALVEDYSRQRQQGRLFYPWHAGHILFEAAVYLLDTAWNCHLWLVELGKSEEITKCIREYPPTLRRVARFWPSLETCADVLDNLAAPVLLRFETGAESGDMPLGLEDEDATSLRIAEHLFPIAEIGVHQALQEDAVSFNFDDFDWTSSQFDFDLLEGNDMFSFYIGPDSTIDHSNMNI